MNYIKQLNEFYSTLDYKPLPANAIAVYTILLQIANRTGWIDKFKVANPILMSKCDLDMQKFIRARNKLINQGYITYLKGKNQTDAPIYSIIKLYKDKTDDIANNIANDIADNIADDIANNKANDNINKQNKTKLKKKNIKKENAKPTLEEIKYYVQEKKLNVDADYFYNYFTAGNWIDSKGNEVKNWKQKLITWSNHNKPIVNEPINKPTFTAIDTSQLTAEEYSKLLKKEITIEELIEKGRVNV